MAALKPFSFRSKEDARSFSQKPFALLLPYISSGEGVVKRVDGDQVEAAAAHTVDFVSDNSVGELVVGRVCDDDTAASLYRSLGLKEKGAGMVAFHRSSTTADFKRVTLYLPLQKAAKKEEVDEFLASLLLEEEGSEYEHIKSAPRTEDDAYFLTSKLKHITASNFDEVVVKSDADVVVEVWATWCTACRRVYPNYVNTALAVHNAGWGKEVVFGVMDSDLNYKHPAYITSTSIPYTAIFKKGAKRSPVVIPSKVVQSGRGEGFVEFLSSHTTSPSFDGEVVKEGLKAAEVEREGLIYRHILRITSLRDMLDETWRRDVITHPSMSEVGEGKEEAQRKEEGRKEKVVVFTEAVQPGTPHTRAFYKYVEMSYSNPSTRFVCVELGGGVMMKTKSGEENGREEEEKKEMRIPLSDDDAVIDKVFYSF